jgi:restriction system protein
MGARYSYQLEIKHPGLNKYRLVKGPDKYVVEQKAKAQLASWDEQWKKHLSRKNKEINKQSKLEEAADRTEDAQEEISNLHNLLKNSLKIRNAFDWEKLKDKNPFPDPKPVEKKPIEVPPEPSPADRKFKPDIGLLDKLFLKRKLKKEEIAKQLFEVDHLEWIKNKEAVNEKNKRFKQDYFDECKQWEIRKQEYLRTQLEKNITIDKRIKMRYSVIAFTADPSVEMLN